MKSILSTKPTQLFGLFFTEKQKLWGQVQKLALQSKSWIYIADEFPILEVKTALELKRLLKKGEILSSFDFYLREPVVRAKPVMAAIEKKVAELQTESLIIFCEMTWAVRSPSGDIYLRELYNAFHNYLETSNITIICLYNESILLTEQLLLGLYSHPQIYTTDGFKDNPYYLPAKIINNSHLKSRFNYWLTNIDIQRQFVLPKSTQANVLEKDDFPLEKIQSTSVAQTSEGRWKISCFGQLRIRRENGELLDWNTKAGATKKLKTIFAFLLLRGERGASLEELADLLWTESDSTEASLNRLYHSIRYLRAILQCSEKDVKGSPFIVQENSVYFLKLPQDSWVDIPMYQELCYKGNQFFKEGNLEQAKICYESAERIYHGVLFKDIPIKYIDNNENDWCWSKRTWFHDMYFKLLYSLANIYRQMGQLTQAIYYCDKVLSEDPTIEAAQKEKLMALAASGRFDALHRQFKIYTESLRKFNLGAPSREIKEIYLNLSKNN
jgi:two-component SAPR family response regulator